MALKANPLFIVQQVSVLCGRTQRHGRLKSDCARGSWRINLQ